MPEIETREEQAALEAAYEDALATGNMDGPGDWRTHQAFVVAWLAGRDWEREQAQAAAIVEEERAAEIREHRERGERLAHPERNPHSIAYGMER